MWTDSVSLNSVILIGFTAMSGAMAAWRETPENEPIVRDVQRAITKSLDIADLSHKEAAHVLDTPSLDYSPQQWSLDLKRGGNLAALVIIGLRHPAFGAALATRLSALLRGGRESIESRIARCERLMAEVHDELSQKEEHATCEVQELGDSSAA